MCNKQLWKCVHQYWLSEPKMLKWHSVLYNCRWKPEARHNRRHFDSSLFMFILYITILFDTAFMMQTSSSEAMQVWSQLDLLSFQSHLFNSLYRVTKQVLAIFQSCVNSPNLTLPNFAKLENQAKLRKVA